jgi:hypothetical protein
VFVCFTNTNRKSSNCYRWQQHVFEITNVKQHRLRCDWNCGINNLSYLGSQQNSFTLSQYNKYRKSNNCIFWTFTHISIFKKPTERCERRRIRVWWDKRRCYCRNCYSSSGSLGASIGISNLLQKTKKKVRLQKMKMIAVCKQ